MRTVRKNTIFIIVMCLFVFTSGYALAQIGSYGIPSTHEVLGNNVVTGDIVSFNPILNTYEATKVKKDENMYGVVDTTPTVVFRSGSNEFPIVRSGEVLVNVTAINGLIETGDSVTSSQIEGKGQKFIDDGGYILGIALEPFDGTVGSTTVFYNETEVVVGYIKVLLSIAPYLENQSDPKTPATVFVRESSNTETGLETIFRYITAALFAFGTIFVVLKTFGPNIGKGVISVGRNPLAKSSIQAMVVFNVILILAIIIASFIVSLLIIFLPL